ncbi:hypothetical protein, partial [Paracoccus yeei]|uniref:hypothetical protein n=1 Tax=Paracoccus yeei TaxID=147645 RepID=UPI0028D38D4B
LRHAPRAAGCQKSVHVKDRLHSERQKAKDDLHWGAARFPQETDSLGGKQTIVNVARRVQRPAKADSRCATSAASIGLPDSAGNDRSL